MDRFNLLRFSRVLALFAVTHLAAIVSMARVIHAEPSENALLVPRPEGVFVVGENEYGLLRVRGFSSLSEAQLYLKKIGLRIPQISYAGMRPLGHMGKVNAFNRITWSDRSAPVGAPSPVIQTHDSITARRFAEWVQDGSLRHSHLGYAIHLEKI
ncbi:MAG TPA: hypothetical protein VM901_00615 [Bdellovibrionota bacterium]|jgi:hypothetical protein|nr:hypothetical protein [Bdellovibrionota bacterium]